MNNCEVRIPLLHDHHSHPLFYSALLSSADLSETRSLPVACELISQAAKSVLPIAVGFGWQDNALVFDDDTLESLPPCAIFNVSLHKLITNPSGKAVLHNECGPLVEKIDDQEWYEANLRVVLNWFAKLGGSEDSLVKFYEHLGRLGVYSAEEMLLVDGYEIDLFEQTGLLDRTKFWAAPDTFDELSLQHRSMVAGLKLFADGALGAKTAALSEPFRSPMPEKESDNFGMLVYSDDEFAKTLSQCSQLADNQKAIAVHAIGDRAIEQTISSLEAMGTERDKFSEIRIEHAQLISLDQARRAKRLAITLSMQPNFNVDSLNYLDRLPENWAWRNNPFRMLIDEVGFVPGKDLIFGSDGMPHGVQEAAQQSFFPAFETSKLTLEEFVAGYCLSPLGSTGTVELEIKESRVELDNDRF